MLCKHCGTNTPDDSQFCSACGSPLFSSDTSSAAHDIAQIEFGLAQANLLRMQAKWLEAENKCIDVMRSDPNNYHAHSLLGDIYRDQGKLEEAKQWYQLALDLNPESKNDPQKIAQIEELKEKHNGSAVYSGGYTDLSSQTQKLIGLPPSLWLKGLMVLSVLFLIMVIFFLNSAQRPHRTDDIKNNDNVSSANVIPSRNTNSPAPAVNMPMAETNMNTTAPPEQSTPAISSTPQNQSAPEAIIQSIFTKVKVIPQNASLEDVHFDVRDSSARLTIMMHNSIADPTSQQSRSDAIRIAFTSAQALFINFFQVQKATIEIRQPVQGGSLEPFFIGDVDRQHVLDTPPDSSSGRMLAAFTNVWPSYENPLP